MNGRRLITCLLLALALVPSPAMARSRMKKAKFTSRARVLRVRHHPQSTAVWCWAASIAMVSEYLSKQPVSDCDVASKLDYANGGDGRCCDSEGRFRDGRCLYGRRTGEMTQVMNRYYGLTGTDFDRPLTFEEVRTSIDAGYPVVARLYMGGRMGHAIVIVGYEPPGTLIIDDPADSEGPGVFAVSHRYLSRKYWVGSWYFRKDEVAGYFSGGKSERMKDAEVRYSGPTRSSVSASFPKLSDPATLEFVDARATQQLAQARDCYDSALSAGAELPAEARVRLSFAVENGNPTWIMMKENGGLPSSVTQCLSEAVSKWRGLFPASGNFADAQQLELSFSRLSGGTAPEAPAAGR